MFPKTDRVATLLREAIAEMELLQEMSKDISSPDDFVSSLSGMTIFRACGMSLQCITECFVKIRNLCGESFFNPYKSIPWKDVFGMRNFLSHEYGDVDALGIFNTVKNNIPELHNLTKLILADVSSGSLK